MYEPLYILTSVIPKDGKFEAYFRDVKSNQTKVVEKGLKYKKYENLPSLLQFFIENNTYPFLFYDSKLNPVGMMKFNSFEKFVSERSTSLDIEVLNPNRFPNPEQDEIVCISYGNKDCVNVRFNGEGKDRIGENYILHFSDEKKLIEGVLGDLAQSPDLFLCGWNSTNFDLWYIKMRAMLLGVSNEIKTHSAKTLYENRKICLLPNFINIDLLPILQYAGLPSTKLEYVSKIFGLESNKMSIEDLWFYHKEKKFDIIIEHNINDVLMTHEVLKKVLYPIYLLAEKTIGTFEYGFYSNLPKNMMVRSLINHYKNYRFTLEKILERINEEIKKFSFDLNQEKIKEKLTIKFTSRLEEAKLLDLPMKIVKKLKSFEPIFEEILKNYEEISSRTKEENFSRMLLSGVVYRILLSMRKKKEYKSKIESLVNEIKNEVKGRIYASSGRYLIVDNIDDQYSYNLTNVILYSKKPKIFLVNCEDFLIGTIPKKPVGMPDKFYKVFIEDLFNLALNQPANQMQNMREKLDKGELHIDDLKIEVRGVNTSQLLSDSQKKNFAYQAVKRDVGERERIYVVKLKKSFLTLEDVRKNPDALKDVDLEYYEKKFSELWKVYNEIKSTQNSLENFFLR
jgi:hypothetical protein